MKKYLWAKVVWVILVGINFQLFSQPVENKIIPSQVEKVVVFSSSGAEITRSFQADVEEGIQSLLVEVNSNFLDRNSLSAKINGQGELLGIQYRQLLLAKYPQEDIEELDRKINQLKMKLQEIKMRKDVLQREEEFLNSFIDFANIQVAEEIKTNFPKTADLINTLTFLDENYQKIYQEKFSLTQEENKLTEEITRLQQQLDNLIQEQKKSKTVVEVLISSSKKQHIFGEITYLVKGAYWKPEYKAEITDQDDFKLKLFAIVWQKTGENWENVDLSLSTYAIMTQMLPKPVPRYLRFSYPEIGAEGKQKDYVLQAKSGRWKDMVESRAGFAPAAMEDIQASVDKMPFAFEYHFPKPVTIEFGRENTIIPIWTKSLPAKLIYYSVPRVVKKVFLTAQVEPQEELLPGEASVFYKGKFLTKSRISNYRPADKLKLNFGEALGIKVNWEKIKDKLDEKFFGNIQRKRVIRNLAYKITVENIKDEKINIQIFDSIPVSTTDEIEVRNLEISLPPSEENVNGQEGVNRWDLELNPREKKEIIIEYSVIYPKDKNIIGL